MVVSDVLLIVALRVAVVMVVVVAELVVSMSLEPRSGEGFCMSIGIWIEIQTDTAATEKQDQADMNAKIDLQRAIHTWMMKGGFGVVYRSKSEGGWRSKSGSARCSQRGKKGPASGECDGIEGEKLKNITSKEVRFIQD